MYIHTSRFLRLLVAFRGPCNEFSDRSALCQDKLLPQRFIYLNGKPMKLKVLSAEWVVRWKNACFEIGQRGRAFIILRSWIRTAHVPEIQKT